MIHERAGVTCTNRTVFTETGHNGQLLFWMRMDIYGPNSRPARLAVWMLERALAEQVTQTQTQSTRGSSRPPNPTPGPVGGPWSSVNQE